MGLQSLGFFIHKMGLSKCVAPSPREAGGLWAPFAGHVLSQTVRVGGGRRGWEAEGCGRGGGGGARGGGEAEGFGSCRCLLPSPFPQLLTPGTRLPEDVYRV